MTTPMRAAGKSDQNGGSMAKRVALTGRCCSGQ
jgi:hypothetical protein